jgi:hypothetical protein
MVREHQQTLVNRWIRLHTVEVAGSIPASPTLKILRFAGKTVNLSEQTLNLQVQALDQALTVKVLEATLR